MKKNILFFTALNANDPNIEAYKEYSLKTWNHYAKLHDLEVVILDTPLCDVEEMRPTWQRWYVYDILESNNIEYDRVALIDIDTMVKWDCPNLFEIVPPDKLGGVKDDLSLEWINNSIEGYRRAFPQFEHTTLDWTEYMNNGVLILPNDGKKLAETIKTFYLSNQEKLRELQHKTLKKGTDQTPVNFITRNEMGHRIKFIPKSYNMTHLDKTYAFHSSMFRKYPIFIEYGYIWHYNGIPREARPGAMKQTWDLIKEHYE